MRSLSGLRMVNVARRWLRGAFVSVVGSAYVIAAVAAIQYEERLAPEFERVGSAWTGLLTRQGVLPL